MNFRLLPALVIGIACSSCQYTKDDASKPITEKDTYQTVGEEIPYETGMEWIEFYRKKQYSQGRLDAMLSYKVSGKNLDTLLNSVSNLVGIAFHYALDEAGQEHVIAIPIDESLDLWSLASDRILIDANTDSPVSSAVAAAWSQNFQKAHPDDIWFHFFGKNIFDDMRALPYFDNIDIEPAINVSNLTPQLLLVVTNDDLSSVGRTASDAPGTVYDASNPCPPCAVD